jgi:hypothetical protein
MLTVVEYDRYDGHRQPGTVIDIVPPARAGAAKTFLDKQIDYITKASDQSHIVKNAKYESILCFPVFGEGKQVLAVVNIDHPAIEAFDRMSDVARREQAFLLTGPALAAMGIVLVDISVYSYVR